MERLGPLCHWCGAGMDHCGSAGKKKTFGINS
jgi:hypothetical protein